jgi:hypothetical protein
MLGEKIKKRKNPQIQGTNEWNFSGKSVALQKMIRHHV